jgi:putative transposase
MKRRLKAPASAGWHHAMNRIEPGGGWLGGRSAAAALVKRLGESCAGFPVDVHAYCLLPRHYHLLVRGERGAVDAAVAAFEAGSAFPRSAPHRRVPVSLGRHLMEVSRYIHLNPVDAGLAWRPEDWPYSSFRGYLGDLRAPSWLTTAAVLARFGAIGARHRHRAYVYAGIDPGTRDVDGRPRWRVLFAPGSLAEDLAWRIEPVLMARRGGPSPAPPMSLPALARRVSWASGVSVASLRAVRLGGPRAAVARGAFVYAARAMGGHRLSDAAAWIGYASPAAAAAAAERFDRALAAHPSLTLLLAAIRGAGGSSSGT